MPVPEQSHPEANRIGLREHLPRGGSPQPAPGPRCSESWLGNERGDQRVVDQ